MSYATEVLRTNSDSRVLLEIDLGETTVQWVNAGAGIWLCDLDNVYSNTIVVDSTLIPGSWAAIDIADVGSMQVDSIGYQKVSTLAEVTTTDASWYWDRDEKELYVHLANNDSPLMHTLTIGAINGFSDVEFTPTDSAILYQGRVRDWPAFGFKRDPLFFGRLQFGGFTVEMINGDGNFDTWGESVDLYGNEVRIKHGYATLDVDDYALLYTGIVEKIEVTEESASFSIADKRSQFKRSINYSTTETNALDVIVDILETYYSVQYGSTFFNTTEWDVAQALAPDITITMDTDETETVINIIENICKAVFGFFLVQADGRFSFKIIDITATSETTIQSTDIFNRHRIAYDPTEVVSSVRIGYAETASGYSYLTDTDRESDVFGQYRVYNQQTFETYLPTSAAAQTLATSIMDYTDEVHGRAQVRVPMKYYERALGDIVDVELERSAQSMVGTKTSEIVGLSYDLRVPAMELEVRFVD